VPFLSFKTPFDRPPRSIARALRSSPAVRAHAALPRRSRTSTGHKIAAIENLAATQNQFDAIDLSDNEIVKLEGFPPLTRLHTLYLNNNRIARIGKNMDEQLPMLKCVILTNNRLGKLADVDPLATFKRLTHLSLMNNPVTRAENYRAYVIYKLKKLKVLDFRKVKPKEREAAEELFGGDEGEAAMEAAKTFVPGVVGEEGAAAASASGPSEEQLRMIKVAIANAATLDEVERLERALTSGVLPKDMKL
jgi:U2 small nuclear ribonucleoprotein A'